MTYKIHLPGMVPPSPNTMRRKYRHPKAYMRLRKVWENSIFICTGAATKSAAIRRMAEGTAKVNVLVEISHKKKYDPDNLVGCVKVCLDAMKNVGFIRDDTSECICLNVVQMNTGALGTTIHLEAPNEGTVIH